MSSLPHSPDAEAGFIAALLVNPSLIPPLVGEVAPEDFHDPTLGKAWEVMIQHAGDARGVDLTVLRAAGVDLDDPFDDVRQASAPAGEYAAIIRTDAVRRNAIVALRSAEKRVRSATESGVYDVVQETVSGILSGHRGGGSLVSLRDAIAHHRPDEGGGLTWGFDPLDRAIQRVRPGQMVVLAARPSVGKTTVAEHIAMHWAWDSPLPVLFVSVEMSTDQLLGRASARYGGLDTISDGYNLFYLDEPRATTALIRSQASRLRLRFGGLRAVAIDYLQLLRDPGEPEHIRVARISGECKALAREFACPVLVLSQLNRLSESRDDRRPRLADLRDSGAIEQDADVVLGLYRPRLDSPDLDMIVLKNRHGGAGANIPLYFDLKSVSIS